MITHLAALLRRLRIANGMTLQEASNRAELTIGHLSDVERGERTPSLEALDRILAVYGHRLTIVDERITELLGPSPRLLDASQDAQQCL